LFTQVNLASITIRRLYEKTVDYGFKTPFFPAVPIIGIITAMGLSIYLLITHPESWIIAVVWVLIGFVIYKFYTSKQELEHNAPLVFTQGPKLRKGYRIMIIFDKRNATKFYKIAKAISEQNDGEITVLNIVNVPRQTPLSLSHGIGDNGLKAIEEFKRTIPGSLRNRFLVRLAHDPTEAILSTAEEQDINTMLVDFSFLRNNRKLLSLTTCDIIGIRLRKHFDEDVSRIIISYDKGRHSDLGLEIGHAFSTKNNSHIRIVRGVVEDPDDEVSVVNRINDKMLELDLKKIQFEKVYGSGNIIPELLKNFKKDKTALLVLGAGNQSESAFSPKTLEIVDKTNKSVIVVRNHRFSGVHARSFFFALIPRLREIKVLYRLYMDLMQIFYSSKAKARKGRYDEKFFDSQNS